MNVDKRHHGDDEPLNEMFSENDLASLFRRTAPQLAEIDVDQLFTSSAAVEGRAAKHPGSRRLGASEMGLAGLGVGGSSRTETTRRMIMRASVAALVLFLAGVPAILLMFGEFGASAAFAAVQQSLDEVRSMTFNVSTRRGDEPAEAVHVKLLGENLGRAEPAGDGSFTVFDRQQRKMMTVMPAQRKALVLTNVEGENPIPNMFEMLIHASRRSVEDLGEREIDGQTRQGFVVEIRGQKLQVWVDPATKLPVRIEQRRQASDEAMFETIFDKFVYNARVDAAQFRLEPPAGYEVESRELHSLDEQKRRAYQRDRAARERAREAAEKLRQQNP